MGRFFCDYYSNASTAEVIPTIIEPGPTSGPGPTSDPGPTSGPTTVPTAAYTIITGPTFAPTTVVDDDEGNITNENKHEQTLVLA